MIDLKYFNSMSTNYGGNFFIAGCDEVGRGPLAGPVVAGCASIHVTNYCQKEIKSLLKKWSNFGITDSKQLKDFDRIDILKNFSIDSVKINQIYTSSPSKNIIIKILVKEIHAPVIDKINILQASLLAMKEAALGSCEDKTPGFILIDGNKKFECERNNVFMEAIVKGDTKSLLIGLASIAAKEYRDQLMKKMSEEFPGYGWEKNAGYPTKKHIEAIAHLGVTSLHRLTFRGVREIYDERGYSRGQDF